MASLSLTHLDTHVCVWLFTSRDLLSGAARQRIEDDTVAVSPMAVLELTYLRDVGRVNYDATEILATLQEEAGVTVDSTPFAHVVEHARGCTWTRDPFDRVIVGQALAAGARLITRDSVIREHLPDAVW